MKESIKESLQNKLDQLKNSTRPEPIRSDGSGALDLGPRNLKRDEENPDMLVPPATDKGLIPNLKFSFSDTNMILRPGGWSREITKRELPISDTFAVVDMNLSPGVREMHTHQQSEWGFVLVGSCRVTAVDEMGRGFAADIFEGEGVDIS